MVWDKDLLNMQGRVCMRMWAQKFGNGVIDITPSPKLILKTKQKLFLTMKDTLI